jgi:hypothetical protein
MELFNNKAITFTDGQCLGIILSVLNDAIVDGYNRRKNDNY